MFAFFKSILVSAGLVAATTFGAGIFALPLVFFGAGWPLGIFYLCALSFFVVISHWLYLEVLSRNVGSRHLIGLTRRLWGEWGSLLAVLVVLGGLLLTLVVYLILAGQMVVFFAPSMSPLSGSIFFWVIVSLPLIFEAKKFVALELWGTIIKAVLALTIFIIGVTVSRGSLMPSSYNDIPQLFLPFGPILFALAGWSAVGPVFEFKKKHGSRGIFAGLALGTFGVAGLYALFVRGIFGLAPMITSDTLSGFAGARNFPGILLGALGLVAIWTVYLAVAREIAKMCADDMKMSMIAAQGVAVLAPVLVVLAGFNNLSSAIELAGGVFLSAQYLLIIAIAQKTLRLTGWRRLGAMLAGSVFFLAIIYEIYYFAR